MHPAGFDIMTIIPLFLVMIPFAIGAYFVGGRMGRRRWVWVILTVVPVVNFFFYFYAFFAVLLYVLDRLNEATGRTRAG